MSFADVNPIASDGGTSDPPKSDEHLLSPGGGLGTGTGAFATFFRQMENEADDETEKGIGGSCVDCSSHQHNPATDGGIHEYLMLARHMEDFDHGSDSGEPHLNAYYYDAWTDDAHDLPMNSGGILVDSEEDLVEEEVIGVGKALGGQLYLPRAGDEFYDDASGALSERDLLQRFHQIGLLEQQQHNHTNPQRHSAHYLGEDGLVLSLHQMTGAISGLQNSLHFEIRERKAPKVIGGRYMLGTRIGNGSYGKVKDCIDIVTLKRYAVKLMSHHIVRRIPNGFRNISRETELMRKLPRHRNVIQWVADFHDENAKRDCLVMEYCLGSIHDLQASGLNDSQYFRRLPEWQVYKYFVQLIDGVEFLHGQRVIHQDLKPGNLLLNACECVKITDFGVSEQLGWFAESDMIRFCQTTPAIQPPEVASGSAKVFSGFKLDYYCCGICLYFMLTGRVPFTTNSMLRIFEVIAEGKYDIPPFVGIQARDLIRHLLEKEPTLRYDISAVRAHPWFQRPPPRVGPGLPLEYLFRNYGLVEQTSCQGTLLDPDCGGPPHYHEGTTLPPSHSEPVHLVAPSSVSPTDNMAVSSPTSQMEEAEDEDANLTQNWSFSVQPSEKSLEEIRRLRNPLTCLSRLRIKHHWPPPCADTERADRHILVGEDITHTGLDESLSRIRPLSANILHLGGHSEGATPSPLPISISQRESGAPSWSPFVFDASGSSSNAVVGVSAPPLQRQVPPPSSVGSSPSPPSTSPVHMKRHSSELPPEHSTRATTPLSEQAAVCSSTIPHAASSSSSNSRPRSRTRLKKNRPCCLM